MTTTTTNRKNNLSVTVIKEVIKNNITSPDMFARYNVEIPKGQKGLAGEFIKTVSKKREERRKRSQENPRVSHIATKRIEKRLAEQFEKIYCNNYIKGSMGQWFRVILDPKADNTISRNVQYVQNGYSRSCKYAAKVYHFTLHLKPSYKLYVIGGMLTLISKNSDEVVWFTRKGNEVNLEKHTGYLYKGKHFTATSEEDKVKQINKIKKERTANALRIRKQRMISRGNVNLASIWVSREDSIKAGNCPFGTDNFINKLPAKIGAIRADYLLELAERFNVTHYAQRAINYAFYRR